MNLSQFKQRLSSRTLSGHPTALFPFAFLFVVGHTTPVHSGRGGARLSPVDVVSLYSMAGSSTPQQCVESHLTDKHTCCIPRTRTCLPAGFLPFDAGLPALLPNFLRLAYAITDVDPRFATGDVVSILPGRVSTY